MATGDEEVSSTDTPPLEPESRSKIFTCAADVLQRITAIETTLNDHIDREEKSQTEVKWVVRLIFASMVGIILHLAELM